MAISSPYNSLKYKILIINSRIINGSRDGAIRAAWGRMESLPYLLAIELVVKKDYNSFDFGGLSA